MADEVGKTEEILAEVGLDTATAEAAKGSDAAPATEGQGELEGESGDAFDFDEKVLSEFGELAESAPDLEKDLGGEPAPEAQGAAESAASAEASNESLLARIAELEARLTSPSAEPPAAETQQVQPTREQFAAQVQKARQEAEVELLETYAMNPELGDQLIREPEKVLPQLAARVHLNVTQTVLEAVMQNLPIWLSRINTTSAQEEKFFSEIEGKFPQLVGHREEMKRVRDTHLALNPKVDRVRLQKDVTLQSLIALGLVRAPTKPAAPAPSARKISTPIRARGTGTRRSAVAEKNEFTLMSEEEEE